jgi:drug/metabolite transporter (DMT)-like permease
VAIGLLTLYSFPAMTAIIEPFMLRVPFRWFNLFLALMVLIGITIMMPSISLEHVHTRAIALGLLSAFLYSIRNIIIKGPSVRHHGGVLMFHQMWMMVLIILPFLYFIDMGEFRSQLTGLLLLGLVTTALGHTLFLYSLKYMPVIKASLLACIVPVYGVLWGFIFLGEIPAIRTIIGGLIILSTVVLTTLDKVKSFD